MRTTGSVWKALLASVGGVFTSPSHSLFIELVSAWVIAPGRRTITAMVAVMDPAARAAHDAYHRFVRAGAWSMDALWAALVVAVVAHVGSGPVHLLIDDTLLHRPGRKVEGAGVWRDAVRSSGKTVVFARGLNIVVVAVRIAPPWGGMPIALPVGVALHRKDGPTLIELAESLVRVLAERVPERPFVLCADGAYASLAGRGLPRTTVVSRMRRDAALYEAPPPPTGKRGRPRTKGDRLATPPGLVKALRPKDWTRADIEWRGRRETRLVWSRPVLWHRVCPKAMVLLVVVRDPDGKEPDDYFFTTELRMAPGRVASIYASRWAIEVTNRDAKQVVGAHEPQSWADQGPARAGALGLWLHGAVWLTYLTATGTREPKMTERDWYPGKATPSFADAMAEVRRALWRERISPRSGPTVLTPKMTTVLLDALATAA
ncbi:MAG TPA: transposase [Acidimicrobiales bacterium]|nr:transposase [Acidimicrobiales bacterium]